MTGADDLVVLGFDTATSDTVVGVRAGPALLAERRAGPEPGGRPRHGSDLLAMVEEAVAEAGGWDSIERIAVGLGPGSFTGARIGVATARALAQGRAIPLAGVLSTAALAAGMPPAAGRPRLAVIDARRGEVFAAVIEPRADLAARPVVAPPGRLSEVLQLGANGLAAGDGAVRFRGELESEGIEVAPDGDPVHRLSARHVCALGAIAEAGDPEGVRPEYLRRPDAERWLERDSRD